MKKLILFILCAAFLVACSDSKDSRFSVHIDVDDEEIEEIVEDAFRDLEDSFEDLKDVRIEISKGSDEVVITLDDTKKDLLEIKEEIRRELRKVKKDLKDVRISIERDVEKLP